MPCSGPDCEGSRRQGREVGQVLLAELIARYRMFDVDDPRYEGTPWHRLSGKSWAEAKEAFVQSVEDLFFHDACNSF